MRAAAGRRPDRCPPELQAPFDKADAELFANVRNVFGGSLEQATSGAAPIAQEILEFFYACGAPVLEGYGMTETSTVSHDLDGRATTGSARSAARCPAARSGSPRTARSSSAARTSSGGYYKSDDATLRRDRSTAGCTPATSARSTRTATSRITGRKKDIIITAGGKNLTPANLENDLKQSRWISQAVMYGDRRPYPVALITLDPEEIVHFAREHGLPEDLGGAGARAEGPRADPGRARRRSTPTTRRSSRSRSSAILDHDLSQETGELTPTLKVKRNVVNEKYADGASRRLYSG